MKFNQSNIGTVLFTKTQQRVLGILYGQVERSFYLNQLVRLADMGKGTISRELEKLATVGILTTTKLGNQTHYQANPDNPIFSELHSIVKKTFAIVGVLSNALQEILPQIDFAFVYGSVAKGSENVNSDIDLMLVTSDLSYSELLEKLEPAEKMLGRKINPTIYSKQELLDRITNKQSFISRILSQNMLWLHGASEFNHWIEKNT